MQRPGMTHAPCGWTLSMTFEPSRLQISVLIVTSLREDEMTFGTTKHEWIGVAGETHRDRQPSRPISVAAQRPQVDVSDPLSTGASRHTGQTVASLT